VGGKRVGGSEYLGKRVGVLEYRRVGVGRLIPQDWANRGREQSASGCRRLADRRDISRTVPGLPSSKE
jgi:hypothetical protein